MLKSMTGFGKTEGETTQGRILVECRSVNHRYCDINVKLAKRLVLFEARIKEFVRSHVSRGRIDLSVKLGAGGEEKTQLDLDLPLAEAYHQVFQTLKEKLRLTGEITLDLFVGAKDLIVVREETGEMEPFWQEVLPVLERSVEAMRGMKRTEGESLGRDIQARLERIRGDLERVKGLFPLRLEGYQRRLHERIRSLLEGTEIDPIRFQQETAFLAERMDITEEIVRAESHLGQFSLLLTGEDPVGRKMDFLLQEIQREINTISAKANDAEISQRVVEMKSELERIREQVQNIE
jgi:uncharacterized protein (TIGR00255 family)